MFFRKVSSIRFSKLFSSRPSSVAVEPEMKRRRFLLDPARVRTAVSEAAAAASTSAPPDDGHRFIEQFNADMMQQFLAHQVRGDIRLGQSQTNTEYMTA